MLEVCRITKDYPSPAGPLRVLDDVSFRLAPGQRLIVMGPSGSGKSTLLAILGAMEEPTSGTVRLGDVDPVGFSPDGRAAFRNARIGFVFQEHHLLQGCSALDNVLIPALATGRVSPEVEARGRHLLDRVGLSDRISHPPSRLSGGERQRVAIARAVLHSPHLILADEPTGQLDSWTASSISDLLVDLADETAAILIVVTHAEAIASRLAAGIPGTVRRLVAGRLEPSDTSVRP
jgi:lipoprotein-releasing system ATP-binding protein